MENVRLGGLFNSRKDRDQHVDIYLTFCILANICICTCYKKYCYEVNHS